VRGMRWIALAALLGCGGADASGQCEEVCANPPAVSAEVIDGACHCRCANGGDFAIEMKPGENYVQVASVAWANAYRLMCSP